MAGHVKICWRCGIDFDTAGDTCVDCIDVDGPGEMEINWPRGGRTTEATIETRKELIYNEWARFRLDSEIADKYGITPRTVARYRKMMGLPAQNNVTRPDRSQWKDAEAQRQHAATMVKYRVAAKRGSLGRMTKLTGKTNGTLDYIEYVRREQ